MFTAITRAKAWLRVSGIGSAAEHFCKELQQSEQNFPNLPFIWPDREKIPTILNDINKRSKKLMEVKQMLLDLELTDLTDAELEMITPLKGK